MCIMFTRMQNKITEKKQNYKPKRQREIIPK